MNDLNGIGSCTGRLSLTKLVCIMGFRFVKRFLTVTMSYEYEGKQMTKAKIQLLYCAEILYLQILKSDKTTESQNQYLYEA